jgi:hypothetical protein
MYVCPEYFYCSFAYLTDFVIYYACSSTEFSDYDAVNMPEKLASLDIFSPYAGLMQRRIMKALYCRAVGITATFVVECSLV